MCSLIPHKRCFMSFAERTGTGPHAPPRVDPASVSCLVHALAIEVRSNCSQNIGTNR